MPKLIDIVTVHGLPVRNYTQVREELALPFLDLEARRGMFLEDKHYAIPYNNVSPVEEFGFDIMITRDEKIQLIAEICSMLGELYIFRPKNLQLDVLNIELADVSFGMVMNDGNLTLELSNQLGIIQLIHVMFHELAHVQCRLTLGHDEIFLKNLRQLVGMFQDLPICPTLAAIFNRFNIDEVNTMRKFYCLDYSLPPDISCRTTIGRETD